MDEFDVLALATKAGIKPQDMKEMTYVSLVNTLIAMVDDGTSDSSDGVREATPEDIKRFFG